MKLKLLLSLVLVASLAGPALAAEPVTVAPESAVTSDAAEEVALPDELTAQLTPEPIYKIGMKPGPCTVSVTCAPGYVISCSSPTVCYWKVHSSWSNPGYVQCNGIRTTCTLSPD